jgi:LmbE family N-acetylglucosaminyl deacetylase
MDNPYLDYVEGILEGVKSVKNIKVSGKNERASGANVLLFSPHPDDECITGLLPFRLMREMGKRIINIPVTYGSNAERQAGRAAELADACDYLGWESFRKTEGLGNLEADDIVEILKELQPEIIFFPHVEDWNSRHISTNILVMEALAKMDSDFSCLVVEAEYWSAMDDPNLMIEADAQTVAELVAATSLHVEEVARNPYHILLPAWMQDNVRRGGELVGGQGGAVPDFGFAVLYRLRKWQGGSLTDILDSGKTVPMGEAALREVF